jgi:K+-sensing histidine kinase KdpD
MTDTEDSLRRGNAPTAISVVRPYAETRAMVGASTFAGMLLAPRWGNSPVDLLYLPAVLAAAALYGLSRGILAAVASALAFNYFFTHPFHTLRISRPQDIATVALLFLVALVTSQLAARMREQARAAKAHARRNATIAGLARQLLSCSSEEQIGEVACRELARLYDCNTVLMTLRPEPRIAAAFPPHATLTPSDMVAAAWTLQSGEAAGRGAASVNAAEWVFYPISTTTSVLGAIGLARDDGLRPVATDTFDLLDNLINQLALALERSRLEEEARSVGEIKERTRLRSALLSTIGQDLEPRLSAITAAVNDLRRGGLFDKGLVTAIGSEAAKLQQYLVNLLDLGPEADEKPVQAGHVSIDLLHRKVTRDGEHVHLAPKEYAVLAELARYPDRVLTHAHLLRAAWGPAQEHQADYLRVAIRALRQKLERDPPRPELILNEPSVGYRLVVNRDQPTPA